MSKVITVALEIQVRIDEGPGSLSLDEVESNLAERATAFLYPAGMTVLSARAVPSTLNPLDNLSERDEAELSCP